MSDKTNARLQEDFADGKRWLVVRFVEAEGEVLSSHADGAKRFGSRQEATHYARDLPERSPGSVWAVVEVLDWSMTQIEWRVAEK